jgi:hypothetical protein
MAAAAALALTADAARIVGAIAAGVSMHFALRTRVRTMLRASAPVAMLSAALMALQWIGGRVDIRLPLRTVAIFALSTAAARLLPPLGLASLTPGSRRRAPALFLFFVRHFASILIGEAMRTYQARALCVASTWSRSGFESLAWATVAVFRRSLGRAERFYAAQIVGGFEE